VLSPAGCGWTGLGGLTMRNSKTAMLWYGLAVGFILAVSLHSPRKVLVASDESAPPTALNAKYSLGNGKWRHPPSSRDRAEGER
jgi:hypothetical protein